ncbi:MAG: Hpt domain-containing protein, partial [Burkholderiales bacterium]
NDILTKPVLPKLLYAALSRWLAAGPGVAPTPPTESLQRSALVFDLESALTRVNGDRATLDRFLQLFRQRNASIAADIGEAIAAGDWETARRLAHALKGGAGTVGLMQLHVAAGQLEATLAEAVLCKEDATRQAQQLAALQAAWELAQQTLHTLLEATAPMPNVLAESV